MGVHGIYTMARYVFPSKVFVDGTEVIHVLCRDSPVVRLPTISCDASTPYSSTIN